MTLYIVRKTFLGKKTPTMCDILEDTCIFDMWYFQSIETHVFMPKN